MKPKGAALWILGPWKDLSLFVLAPVWVIPLVWIAKGHFDPNGFGAALLAIGGTGHHLPGFIRAYTDPLLFRRFRTRFILAPLFFLGVYVLFSALHLESLKLVLILWGTWHGAMQVNGFLRIYDAKAGSFSTITAWLDWAMCLVWFGGALFYSSRLISILTYFFNAGGAPIQPALFNLLRQGWMTVLAGVTLAFAVNAWKQSQLGVPPNPIKVLMMASSFALWWFAMISVSSLLVGLLLFEIIHDVQYNALVWVYNERRVSQRTAASRVEKFLFRPGAARGLLYVLLILAYGGVADVLGYAAVQAPSALQLSVSSVTFWTGLFMVSTFLHFYFDGFIWQVREKDFRQNIGIGNSEAVPQRASSVRSPFAWLPAGWKWAFFLIPTAVLGISEYRSSPMPLLEQARNVVQLIPDRWQANAVMGTLEKTMGAEEQALEHLQRAVDLNASYPHGEVMLADIYTRLGDSDRALQHYRKAAALNPDSHEEQAYLGKMLAATGHLEEAIPHLRAAAEHYPEDANLAYVLGASLVEKKKDVEGIPYLRRAVRLDPKHKDAWTILGIALQNQGHIQEAAAYYRKALELDSGYIPARQNLDQAERILTNSNR